jgi:tetratricopeptide (TPR) repeat protein
VLLTAASALGFSCKSAPKSTTTTLPPSVSAQEPVGPVSASEVSEPVQEESASAEDTIVSGLEIDYEALEKAQDEYGELGAVLDEAQAKKQEALESGFGETYQERFAAADEALNRALEAYGAGFDAFSETALTDGRAALSGFAAIVDGVWMPQANALYETSSSLRQQALILKADIAVKEPYSLAAELHDKGEAALHDKNYRAATGFYEEAVAAFTEIVKISGEKKTNAELAMKNADEKISESEKIIEDAIRFIEDTAVEKGESL